jgi:hypothetical protein
MMLIARTVFPKARITNDRFHVQKLYYDALDELRITLRWMARDMENEEINAAGKKEWRMFLFDMPMATHENSCRLVQNLSQNVHFNINS